MMILQSTASKTVMQQISFFYYTFITLANAVLVIGVRSNKFLNRSNLMTRRALKFKKQNEKQNKKYKNFREYILQGRWLCIN